MAADVFSIIIAVSLCLFFMVFGQVMIEAKPGKCPWERDERGPVPDGVNYEARSRQAWQSFRSAWGADDLHHAQ